MIGSSRAAAGRRTSAPRYRCKRRPAPCSSGPRCRGAHQGELAPALRWGTPEGRADGGSIANAIDPFCSEAVERGFDHLPGVRLQARPAASGPPSSSGQRDLGGPTALQRVQHAVRGPSAERCRTAIPGTPAGPCVGMAARVGGARLLKAAGRRPSKRRAAISCFSRVGSIGIVVLVNARVTRRCLSALRIAADLNRFDVCRLCACCRCGPGVNSAGCRQIAGDRRAGFPCTPGDAQDGWKARWSGDNRSWSAVPIE